MILVVTCITTFIRETMAAHLLGLPYAFQMALKPLPAQTVHQAGVFTHYLRRRINRLADLFAAWQAGTLKPVRPRAPRAKPATPKAPPLLRIPTTRGWASRLSNMLTSNVRIRFERLFAEPEFQRFLATEPRAGRHIRPICFDTGMTIPDSIRPLRRKRKPKPKPTPKRLTPEQKAELLAPYPPPGTPLRWQTRIPGLNAPIPKNWKK
jgi:hypothetical protein